MKNRNLLNSFKNAFCGIKTTFKNERNFKIHIVFAIFAICASFYFGIDGLSFATVLFAIGVVLASELMNTAIEALVDLYCADKPNILAKTAKDAAAAAVLMSSFFALLVGIIVFGGKVLDYFPSLR